MLFDLGHTCNSCNLEKTGNSQALQHRILTANQQYSTARQLRLVHKKYTRHWVRIQMSHTHTHTQLSKTKIKFKKWYTLHQSCNICMKSKRKKKKINFKPFQSSRLIILNILRLKQKFNPTTTTKKQS